MTDELERRLARAVSADHGELAEEREETLHLRNHCVTPRCPICIRAAQRYFSLAADVFIARDALLEHSLKSPRLERVVDELALLAPRMKEICERLLGELA